MHWLRDIAARFASAVQYLTVLRPGALLPFVRVRVPYEEAAVFLPLVGGLTGAFSGLALWAFTQLPLHKGLSTALVLAGFTAFSGFRQEAGLMGVSSDVGAIRGLASAGATANRESNRLAVEARGVALVVLSLLIRWQALAVLADSPLWFLLAATTSAGLLSRSSIIFLAASAPPRGLGSVAAFIGDVPGWLLLATGLQASVAVSLMGWQGTAPLVVGGVLLVLVLRWWFVRRLGGLNGHCLCACVAATESFVLIVAAWRGAF